MHVVREYRPRRAARVRSLYMYGRVLNVPADKAVLATGSEDRHDDTIYIASIDRVTLSNILTCTLVRPPGPGHAGDKGSRRQQLAPTRTGVQTRHRRPYRLSS